MKRLVFFLAMLLVPSGSAWAQGYVWFGNRPSDLSSPPDRLVRFDPLTVGTDAPNPFGTNNAPVVGTNFVAQLYYGASTAAAGSLVAVSSAPAIFGPSTIRIPGCWSPGGRFLYGFSSGDTVNLQVRVWDSAYGSTFEEAAGRGIQGESLVFSYHGPDPGFDVPVTMENFQGFTIGIPEPSIFGLGILGFATLSGLVYLNRGKGTLKKHGNHKQGG